MSFSPAHFYSRFQALILCDQFHRLSRRRFHGPRQCHPPPLLGQHPTKAFSVCSQVKPFKVHSGPFIRDVSFAIVAVALLLIVLHDGSLHLYEAIAMIGLYGCYVAWVIGGAWFLRHRQEKFKAKRRGRDEIEAGATQGERPFLLE